MRFVFATEEVGFKRYLPHLQITLTTLAEEPRLFALDNFLTEDDASQLIEDALAIQDDEHKLTRSSVGAKGYTVSSTRTSENAWVKDTRTAMRARGVPLRHRCDSCPSHDDVGRFFFEFEAIRTAMLRAGA